MTPNSESGRPCKPYAAVVFGAMTLYAAVLCAACHVKYLTFGYDDFDLAVHAQSLWSIVHGSAACSILNIPFLGNHMALILYLLAPVYLLVSSPLVLLYAQSLTLAAGAWAVYLLATRELSPRWGAGLALAWLIYPPLIYMNLYEFHPIALATTFLMYALCFFRTDRFRLFMLFLFLAMLCQENVALIAVFFAFYSLVSRKPCKTWALLPAAAGIAWFVIGVCIVMPMLNRNTIQFLRIYSHLGDTPPAMVGNALRHPVDLMKFCAHPMKLNFLNSLFAPLGYLSLAGPLTLIPALPVFAQRLLSGRVSEALLVYHYQAELVPFVFASAILGIRKLLRFRHGTVRLLTVALITLFPPAALVLSGVVPAVTADLRAYHERTALSREADRALDAIPSNASVVATFRFLPRLSGRSELRSLHHIYRGKHTLSDVPFPPPTDVDYLLLDVNDRVTFLGESFYTVDGYRSIQAILDDAEWETVAHLDGIIALKRSAATDAAPPRLVGEATPGAELLTNFTCTADESIDLLGFTAGRPDQDNNMELTLYWSKPQSSDRDYDMYIVVSDTGPVYVGRLAPGSRIWPPQSWAAGTTTADRHRIHLSRRVSPDAVHIAVKLIRRH